MIKTLQDAIKNAEKWPRADQEELAEYAREIEARRTGTYVMSDAERAAVREGLAEADRGELVSDESTAKADNVKSELKDILDRVPSWPDEAQQALAEIALEIEAAFRGGVYHATEEELRAIDEAERSGTATEVEVEAAFRTFRRA